VKNYLSYPGEVDLSAYVNFKALKEAAEKTPGILASDPMPQGLFLESMGMNTRLSVFFKLRCSATKRTRKKSNGLSSPTCVSFIPTKWAESTKYNMSAKRAMGKRSLLYNKKNSLRSSIDFFIVYL
jgi:hypothetical protein